MRNIDGNSDVRSEETKKIAKSLECDTTKRDLEKSLRLNCDKLHDDLIDNSYEFHDRITWKVRIEMCHVKYLIE